MIIPWLSMNTASTSLKSLKVSVRYALQSAIRFVVREIHDSYRLKRRGLAFAMHHKRRKNN